MSHIKIKTAMGEMVIAKEAVLLFHKKQDPRRPKNDQEMYILVSPTQETFDITKEEYERVSALLTQSIPLTIPSASASSLNPTDPKNAQIPDHMKQIMKDAEVTYDIKNRKPGKYDLRLAASEIDKIVPQEMVELERGGMVHREYGDIYRSGGKFWLKPKRKNKK